MKKISLSAAAILLAAATLFAEGAEMVKNQPKKAKRECQGTCLKKFKTQKMHKQPRLPGHEDLWRNLL